MKNESLFDWKTRIELAYTSLSMDHPNLLPAIFVISATTIFGVYDAHARFKVSPFDKNIREIHLPDCTREKSEKFNNDGRIYTITCGSPSPAP
jgi:hypothetical protein